MATINLAATDVASHPTTIADGIGQLQQPMAIALVQPISVPAQQAQLNEPSSLALALIGVATLTAYRALLHQVVGRPATKQALQPLVKPRRRAA
jgi:hypothetical protein